MLTGIDFTGLVQLAKWACVIFISHQIWGLFSCVPSAHRPRCCGSVRSALRAQVLKAWSSARGGPEVAEPLGDGAWGESAGHLGGTCRGFWDIDLFLSLSASGSSEQPAPSIMVISLLRQHTSDKEHQTKGFTVACGPRTQSITVG